MFEKPTSKIYDLSVIDAEDELDVELTRLYAKHQEAAKNKSEIEFHNYLQEKASQNKREYNEVVSALLYGVLTEPNNARVYFQSISFVNRDNFSVIVNRLQALTISIKFQQLKLAVREQIFWLVSELTSLSVQSVDSLYLSLLRQIKGGDISQRNVLLCDQILKLCESQKSWLDMNPRVIATFVYTYLRVIPDHRQIQLQQLQQREIRITISLLREKWTACVPIGRDLARVLHDLASIPEFSQLWEDILKQPQKLSPRFKGLDVLLLQPTPKEFLRSRLTPDMEFKLLYIVQNLKITMYQRNLNWFIQRYLNTPEMEPHYVDVIRYLVAGWYPSNQILQSDIVPRYVVIGSMIRSVKSSVVAANIKLALMYDWLFFTPNDNIMFIEPAMLLMERSAERYPYITAILMEFLKYAVEEYYPPMKDYIARCVSCGMRVMLSKGVIRSLMPLYKCPSVDPNTKEYMQILFSEFLTEDPSIPSLPIPSMPNSVSLQPVTTPAENKSNKLEDKQEEKGTSEQSSMENDIDVDEFLYGESENKNAVTNQATTLQSEDEDENMVDIPDVTPSEVAPAEAAPAEVIIKDKSTEENNSTPEIELQTSVVSVEESMEDSDEELEEIVDDEGLQSNQSYWIFGDSLKRFKNASIALLTAQKDKNEEEYTLQLLITKRSIKDIIAVFLRMAIPAEVLERTIGPYIRNIIYLNRFPFTFVKTTEEAKNTVSEEAVISDTSKDVFDLLMITFWNLLEKENEREKLIKLLSCIAHNSKKRSRRHLIGMRWWSFISRQEEQEDTNSEKWFPPIVSYYETYVMHIRTMEESKDDSVHFLKEYLINDLRSLAEQNVIYFNHLIPLLYRYLPHVVVGNLDLLKLVLMMILPDKLGRMVCDLHFGSIRVFGDQFDPMFIDASFKIPSYETMCFWQLLAAELQGKTKVVESIFAKAQTIDILKTQCK
ncbi:hypothetical protein G6F45_006922 [Rhizopus arrhizus]|uniref:Integrator complex subunit 3 n=1 Tax=Rhizopus delemar TaxID=936053 RepID=A0A9P7CJK7_9FUNG|nr:hypothetical protein G6F50_010435 [Rhizopus delemar]KAG1628443.1 hypothetical protein G6F45_006922 [Rhizopus arrhizus]